MLTHEISHAALFSYHVFLPLDLEEEVADFHKKYVNLIEQVLNNPQIKLGEITL